jgi:hypothetical protein
VGPTGATGVIRTAGPSGPTGPASVSGPSGATGCTPANGQTTPSDPLACLAQQANRATDALEQVNALKLPIGWDSTNTHGNAFARIGGWLLTILALSLGAPFWFDVLNKLARLRGSGVPSAPDTSGSVGQSEPASGSHPDRGVAKRRRATRRRPPASG